MINLMEEVPLPRKKGFYKDVAVRVSPETRDRFKEFCKRRQLFMGGLAENVLNSYMNSVEAAEEETN